MYQPPRLTYVSKQEKHQLMREYFLSLGVVIYCDHVPYLEAEMPFREKKNKTNHTKRRST